jgi:hypothetical protein
MSNKKLDKILGKILALCKEIKLKEPPNDSGFIRSFFTGKVAYLPISGIGIEWWFTKKALELCEEIADMAISYNPSLRAGDTKSFCKIIENVFQDNAINTNIFSDLVFWRKMNINTLFEASASSDKREFSMKLWNKIYQALSESLINWLVIYPLHRVRTKSVAIGFDGISLLESNDGLTWEKLSESYLEAKSWNPLTGKEYPDDPNFWGKPPETWLVCEVIGNNESARKQAEGKMRTFIAVLFAHLYEKEQSLLIRSMADEIKYSIQFPIDGKKAKCGCTIANIGIILPPLIKDINLPEEIIFEIKNWYTLKASALENKAKRAATASHFINYAINSDELERFIHFFIALDSLFGVRSKVETSIKEGIERTFNNKLWLEKTENLFNLRSELIHGGVSLIQDWAGLPHYKKRFRSLPLEDISYAALFALKKYFIL